VIGEGSIIGGNVWLTKSVPPYSKVYHTHEVSLLKEKIKE
jgi:serine O-acetyltransferase